MGPTCIKLCPATHFCNRCLGSPMLESYTFGRHSYLCVDISFLIDLGVLLWAGVPIPAWFHRDSPPPPPPSLPLILIGPGTGCAPFRAFVEERAVQSVSWPTAPVLFFFGCRSEDSDFLYRDFWLSHAHGKGVLSEERGGGFFVAFSRDQPQKVYVQHKMKEQSEKVWTLLSAGAAVYIAGSSTKMPADVHSCLEEIVSKQGGVPRESAARWLRMLERDGRYNLETWSWKMGGLEHDSSSFKINNYTPGHGCCCDVEHCLTTILRCNPLLIFLPDVNPIFVGKDGSQGKHIWSLPCA